VSLSLVFFGEKGRNGVKRHVGDRSFIGDKVGFAALSYRNNDGLH